MTKKISRKDEILQTLAKMLESNEGASRITTAKLAQQVGVSEAALYRHFSSKQKMFESLIDYIETTLFSMINAILKEEKNAEQRLKQVFILLLGFAEKNPGLSRIMTGHALVFEDDDLSRKISLVMDKVETQIKQILRERKLRENQNLSTDESLLASQFMAIFEGLVNRFVRTNFQFSPTLGFMDRWKLIQLQLI